MSKPLKIVVFDLDETLGYFTEFGIFCDCLNSTLKKPNYSDFHFNELLDLYPQFVRPKMLNILNYLKNKKKENKCYQVMIYTNNQGDKSWASNIKKYFDKKVDFKLFDKIIAAFKVRGERVELGRTSHDKTMEDFVRCTKLPDNIEMCFVDDVYHSGMIDDKVYYINVKPYKHQISIDDMIATFLKSNLGVVIKNKDAFIHAMKRDFKRYSYNISEKNASEQEVDDIIGKRMLQHLKQFFYEKTNKTYKKQKGRQNGSQYNRESFSQLGKPYKNKTLKRKKL
jgi:hypothetical protein